MYVSIHLITSQIPKGQMVVRYDYLFSTLVQYYHSESKGIVQNSNHINIIFSRIIKIMS